ncbi:putative protein kinase RLK-Pelle-LRR-III family [Helianthus annuus]|nr:putative protein kinase RLK-Pelle-LRR-III family [Helianthus annuus]
MSALVFFVLSLFNFIHPTGAESAPRYYTQESALRTFINNVNPPATLNWSESQSHCFWKGISCGPDGITVLYLRLPGRNLTGNIPPNSIGMLTSLRVLSLRVNNLSGPIPSDFSNLKYLTRLLLNSNSFSGNIPSSFSYLPYLIALRLENNNFSGYLPDMKNAQDLTMFNVSYNKLVGPTSYVKPDNTSTGRRAIFGIYSGSTMLLLILFGSVGKRMYQRIIPPSKLMEEKKLVTFEDDVFDLDDLLKTTAEVLGEGSLGTSYKQMLVGKNKTVVVKILKNVVMAEEEFKIKMDVLGKIKNKYVVPLRAFCSFSSVEKLLVYDYMPAGSLFARLHGNVFISNYYLSLHFDFSQHT